LRGEATPAFVYAPWLPEAGESGTLEGDERHHVVNVCRAGVGDRATATDGNGRRAVIRIASVERRLTYEVESVELVSQGPLGTIACGAPEGTRGDWLIEKLAEFGIVQFQPLDFARGRWRWSASRAARCERIAVAALKQSQRTHRMRIAAPVPFSPRWAAEQREDETHWFADQAGAAAPVDPGPRPFLGVCGPASGFDGAEREGLLAAGFVPVRLALGVLRGETAAVALAAAWAAASASRRG
jgi:16S rRNA (uracil1498-N3)-methyltransferase